MDARQLRTFLKIVELGSITRAAEALGLAQPSLSQQVLRLEDEVGVKLFRRTARGVTTTEGGRIFEEHARHILQTIEQALEDVHQLRGEASGQVSFAVPGSVSKAMGLDLVETVLKRAPRVQLQFVEAFSGHIRAWLDEGRIDLGILYDVGPLRHLTVKRLAREEMYLIGPAGRFGPLEKAKPVKAREIGEFPLILPSPLHGLRQFLDREAHRLGLKLAITTEIDSLSHINNLISRGHGFSILPLPAVSEFLEAGKVTVARIENSALKRTLCLVRNPTRVVTRASVRVEDLAIKVARSLIQKGRWRAELEPALAE